MSDVPDPEKPPRPTPRPRPGARPTPTPRPRVAGSRRDREEPDQPTVRTPRPTPPARPRPAGRPDRVAASGPAAARGGVPAAGRKGAVEVAAKPSRSAAVGTTKPKPTTKPKTKPRTMSTATTSATSSATSTAGRRRAPALVLVLTVLCVLAAGGGGWLLWQRLHPAYVTPSVFQAARKDVQALYAFDYKHAQASIAGKLAVLTGDLRDQYKKDLSQGGIIDTYKQVSATTSYNVVDVGLQQINDAQDSATVVVFGEYVVKSVNSDSKQAPQGSECQVTPEGAQSCTQTLRLHVVRTGGTWKISQVNWLTTS